MKRYIIVLLSLLAVTFSACAQKTGPGYVVGFYNLENLFDIYHDDGKNDYQYLPDGSNQWTETKYKKKVHNMARVIRAMADDNARFHTILGVSEIENRHVLEDLVCDPQIASANFQIIHFDGPDRRGVDVALLYRPDQFTVLESRSIPFTFDSKIKFDLTPIEQEEFRTRDVLMVRGMMGGEMFAFYVCHLPSRLGGKGADLRSRGGEIIYQDAMKLMQEFPGIKIAAMGDMNDNPTDESMAVYLHGKEKMEEVTSEDFYDPFLSMYKDGYGTLAYRGEWSIFDLILVNETLAKGSTGSLQLQPLVRRRGKTYFGRVFQKDFMTQQEGQYQGTPLRTFSNGAFVGGYSDHYPTYILIGKNK